ncbi:MAG: Na+/H+ antiporter subunit E [Halanaerobiales bacterium]
MRRIIFTFLLAFIVWIIFAGRVSPEVLLVGFLVATVTAGLFSNMLFRHTSTRTKPAVYLRRLGLIVMFVPLFFYEALISAVKVARHVFERKPSFSPGIVRVKTRLTNVTALTVLANMITLTPGTLTLDFDVSERAYYIHWIDAKTREEAETRKEIIERFENWLDVIFK